MNRLIRYFECSHLPKGPMQETSFYCALLAKRMDAELPESPEKTAGLRKLLEAKDCFVRAQLDVVNAELGERSTER